MDATFHGLPPLKRLRIIQQEEQKLQQQQHGRPLPTKKRKETRDSAFLPDPPVSASLTAYSLPAKKRVWALQPECTPTLVVSESPFDLNVEYKPSVEEENNPVDLEPNNEVLVVADSANQSTENPQDEKEEDRGEEIDSDADEDDGILCTVCGSTDGDPTDPIVFCDGCDLMVHATCYGNPLVEGVPEGDWFCSECFALSSSKSKKDEKGFSCCLCPIKEGAMKPTTDGKWAHIVCALLVPEVFFRDPEGRDGIDCSQVPKKRWMEKCYICNSLNGCAIVCSESKCSLAFHVSCGLKEELSIEYKEGRSATIVAGFCKTHTEVWKKQQQSGKYKIVAAS